VRACAWFFCWPKWWAEKRFFSLLLFAELEKIAFTVKLYDDNFCHFVVEEVEKDKDELPDERMLGSRLKIVYREVWKFELLAFSLIWTSLGCAQWAVMRIRRVERKSSMIST
jgi:hypothetical protein